MPVISTKELQQATVAGLVGAISLDTSVFERYQFGFESGVIAKMSQFSRLDKTHLALDIVLHEIRTHLKREAALVHSKVVNAFKPLGNSWGIDKAKRTEALNMLFGEVSGDQRTEKRLEDFLHDSSATVLCCADLVNLSDLLKKFLETKPPFGTNEAKKHEFPDAIALLALERWAIENNTKVLAVSSDGDWKQFCMESDYVYYTEDLTLALSVFQGNANDAVELFKSMLKDGKIANIDHFIIRAVLEQSDKLEVRFEASSNFYYENDLQGIQASSESSFTNQIENINVIDYENNTLVFQTSLTMDVTVTYDVNFEHWDSGDREYMSMGSAEISSTETEVLSFIITVIFEDGKATIDTIELLPKIITRDFSEIEPDWMNDSISEQGD